MILYSQKQLFWKEFIIATVSDSEGKYCEPKATGQKGVLTEHKESSQSFIQFSQVQKSSFEGANPLVFIPFWSFYLRSCDETCL